jgi:subtilisin family serine protease
MKTAAKTARFVLVALLLVPYVIPYGEQLVPEVLAQATLGSKISSDLLEKLNPGHSPSQDSSSGKADVEAKQDRIPVIIQTSAAPAFGFLSAARTLGGSVSRTYRNFNQVALELPAAAVAALASRSDVKYVSVDRPTEMMGHLEATTGASLVRNYGTPSTGTINGTGIGIAVLDSGIYSAHHSFNTGRVVASIDFTGEGRTDDPHGHGTHVASTAAGNNHISNGAYTGVAPAAKIINVRVLNSLGQGSTSSALAGIDWCITNKALYNIRVLNLSFGVTAVDSYVNDPLCQAVRRAFDAGLVVCVAAGNSGKDAAGNKVFGALHSPGIEPSAITVGAANTYGTNSRSDDQVATYSSCGPSRGHTTASNGVKYYDNVIKPDLVAPGNKIIAAASPNNRLLAESPSLNANVSTTAFHKMMYMSGSSMATPAVAGAAALVLQRNPALTPNLVKAVLEYTAQPLAGFSTYEQGAGELNVEGAVRLAGLIRQDLSGLTLGATLLVGAAPAQSTTIGGTGFVWGAGLIQKWNFIHGNNLILKYQGIYGSSTLLTDGVLRSNGSLLANGTLLTEGALISDGALIADGTLLASGTLLTLGSVLADGTLLVDGALISDGALMSDSYLAASTPGALSLALAMAALGGDLTGSMPVELDVNPLN